MQFNVPQFIDIEDRIVGPLTAKQLGWLALGGVLLLVLWTLLDFGGFLVAGLFVGLIFGSLAFLRPHNQPLFTFILASFNFFLKPKIYVWKKDPVKTGIKTKTGKLSPKQKIAIPKKALNIQNLEKISEIMDKNQL